ncbi:thiamine pyrophosphate-dependent dehydrogenase E1 component subunit alpha [Paenibacillus polymyxa]|uniref:thiamine pyrophosphate-dependent dehydrogenase E1 component subunit alpha n=1 Tax=Paenibacillus polymyxa TaxID=1406 RepID=UPI003216EF1C
MCSYDYADLRAMLTIRSFELTVLDLFSKALIRGTTHTCLGQEYVPVAMSNFISDQDFVISNHRGHGHFLSLFNDVEGLLGEIIGREGAVCKGIGGSQHIFHKNFMSTGVQGEGIAVGVGIAWSFMHTSKDHVCFVYIGDGTFGRGAVYESLNLACLMKLPIVIIVENNGIAMTTFQKDNMSGTIEARVKAFGANYILQESHDVGRIRTALEHPVAEVRSGSGPLVVEFITERVAAHSKGDDTRDKAELEAIKKRYWYNVCAKNNPEFLAACEEEIKEKMNRTLFTVMQKNPEVWEDYEKRICP